MAPGSLVANNRDLLRRTAETVHDAAEFAMSSSPARIEDIELQIQADGIDYLLVQFVDIHGSAKVKLVPSSELRAVVETGAGFAGGAVWGMGQGPHSHDLIARADVSTYTPLPYEEGVARLASYLHVNGMPHPFCPRVNLQRVLQKAREAGFVFNVGIEPEFFLVKRVTTVRSKDGTLTASTT